MISSIVTDIEGTTTSVSFVYDVLFPYARSHLTKYVSEHYNDPVIVENLAEVNRLTDKSLDQQQAIAQLHEWMDKDMKITPLKAIQGMIWDDGYRRGDFKGHVYEDVPASLRRWRESNIDLYVYSSGSIKAQKLLFSHTEYGDLTPCFRDYFDTTTGAKTDSISYKQICQKTGHAPEDTLFLSDVSLELDAASSTGLQTVLVDRKGDQKGSNYQRIHNFNELVIN